MDWPPAAGAWAGVALKRRRPGEAHGVGDAPGGGAVPGRSLSSVGSDPDDSVGHLVAGPGDRIADRCAWPLLPRVAPSRRAACCFRRAAAAVERRR